MFHVKHAESCRNMELFHVEQFVECDFCVRRLYHPIRLRESLRVAEARMVMRARTNRYVTEFTIRS